MQRAPAAPRAAAGLAPASVQDVVSAGPAARPRGARLLRAPLRPGFFRCACPYGQPRSHLGRSVNALAYTVGPNVVFAAGRSAPAS